MYGKNDVQLDFEEYDQLADDQKDYYKQELHEALTGYYFYDTSLQTANEENKISEVSGTIHGIPTFAAILALCGRVFGLTHMVDIQTIYFVCAVFLIYMLAKDLRMKKGVTILLTTVTAISPIILWTAKSSLTEVFLIILMELYIYGIVNYQDKKKCWFAVVAIVTFSFYHFTIYTMLPMFILIYWGLFIAKGEKKIIYQCVTVVLGALLGICMSCFVAPAYTIGGVIDGRRTGNFKPLYDLIPWINESNVLTVTCIAGLAAIMVSIALLILKKKVCLRIQNVRVIFPWLLKIVMVGSLGLVILNIFQSKTTEVNWLTVVKQSTFVGFGMVTGGVLLVSLIVLWIMKTKILTINMQNLIISSMFIYCILIYSIVLRPHILYYYYFGRYLAPYVPILIICAGILLNNVGEQMIYTQLIMTIIILMPFLPFFYYSNDDTQLSRETLTELAEVIETNSAVIMNSQTGRLLYLPVRTMTGTSVYFEEEDFENQLKKLSENVDKVYYITVSTETEEIEEKVNVNIVFRKVDKTGENCEYNHKLPLPFPVSVTKEVTQISCYEIKND